MLDIERIIPPSCISSAAFIEYFDGASDFLAISKGKTLYYYRVDGNSLSAPYQHEFDVDIKELVAIKHNNSFQGSLIVIFCNLYASVVTFARDDVVVSSSTYLPYLEWSKRVIFKTHPSMIVFQVSSNGFKILMVNEDSQPGRMIPFMIGCENIIDYDFIGPVGSVCRIAVLCKEFKGGPKLRVLEVDAEKYSVTEDTSLTTELPSDTYKISAYIPETHSVIVAFTSQQLIRVIYNAALKPIVKTATIFTPNPVRIFTRLHDSVFAIVDTVGTVKTAEIQDDGPIFFYNSKTIIPASRLIMLAESLVFALSEREGGLVYSIDGTEFKLESQNKVDGPVLEIVDSTTIHFENCVRKIQESHLVAELGRIRAKDVIRCYSIVYNGEPCYLLSSLRSSVLIAQDLSEIENHPFKGHVAFFKQFSDTHYAWSDLENIYTEKTSLRIQHNSATATDSKIIVSTREGIVVINHADLSIVGRNTTENCIGLASQENTFAALFRDKVLVMKDDLTVIATMPFICHIKLIQYVLGELIGICSDNGIYVFSISKRIGEHKFTNAVQISDSSAVLCGEFPHILYSNYKMALIQMQPINSLAKVKQGYIASQPDSVSVIKISEGLGMKAGTKKEVRCDIFDSSGIQVKDKEIKLISQFDDSVAAKQELSTKPIGVYHYCGFICAVCEDKFIFFSSDLETEINTYTFEDSTGKAVCASRTASGAVVGHTSSMCRYEFNRKQINQVEVSVIGTTSCGYPQLVVSSANNVLWIEFCDILTLTNSSLEKIYQDRIDHKITAGAIGTESVLLGTDTGLILVYKIGTTGLQLTNRICVHQPITAVFDSLIGTGNGCVYRLGKSTKQGAYVDNMNDAFISSGVVTRAININPLYSNIQCSHILF